MKFGKNKTNTQEVTDSGKKSNVKISEKEAKKALKDHEDEAKKLLQDKEKMDILLNQVSERIGKITGIIDKFADIPLIVSLIRSYMKHEYREIPLGTMIGLVSALIYFVSPVDLIPDTIPGVGYIDDAVVVGCALRFAYTDVEEYKKWVQEQGEKND